MLVLASQSTGRLATLRAAGVDPQVRVSDVDEPRVLAELADAHAAADAPAPTPAEQVQALARAKALDVADALPPAAAEADPDLVVVGCDSMLEIDGAVVGKPGTAQRARERWLTMRGRSGTLHTGHSLVRARDAATVEGVSSTIVHFGSPSDAEIDAYIASGEPLWCAGAFTIDGLGGAFIDGVEGDPHGVVGISLPLLRRLLAHLGVTWTNLWSAPAH
ncbi:Maf family protein [Actinomyces succiniciruminis]|uniref:Nucleoside triphosphate pyrophosphatase n=1 Tax=Actinomyces succiniciruminis TaxID=1522002 RepID=A0A1L7RMD3_9ACTO|nr:Maf family protein [Actinomyces succiniciruminis]CED90233.1 Maf-like protein MSMEG 1811/MSMEI 1767 [Actinomyces succiniciruminis]